VTPLVYRFVPLHYIRTVRIINVFISDESRTKKQVSIHPGATRNIKDKVLCNPKCKSLLSAGIPDVHLTGWEVLKIKYETKKVVVRQPPWWIDVQNTSYIYVRT
jgi:delta-aminolevulinic acid dehydratase/porphobilinogen synthase